MFDVSFAGAFLAGLVSFVSPCVLPIVPPFLAWLAGVSLTGDDRGPATGRVLATVLAFVLGFATVFVGLGATASLIGQALARWYDTLAVVAGLLIVLMGLHFLGLLRVNILYREARVNVAARPAGLAGAVLVGLAFAFGWTPCVGPVLATILFLAGGEGEPLRGALLLGAYAAGMGLPFLVAAAFAGRFLAASRALRRHFAAIGRATGALLVVTGIVVMTGQMSRIAQWLLDTFPVFASLG